MSSYVSLRYEHKTNDKPQASSSRKLDNDCDVIFMLKM